MPFSIVFEWGVMRINRPLAFLLILVMAAGCGVRWISETIDVDPAAISEVRGVGRKVAETTTSLIYEDVTQNISILILDVGASSFQEAANLTHGRLYQHGWIEKGRGIDSIHMKSARWKKTSLLIKPIESLEGYGVTQDPQVVKALEDDSIQSAAYVVLAFTPYA
ncbi:hypothetical protein [Planomonospora venezuelensis]|uniref:Uncharacterized protein n=1 Tax=Planomonospora venezuelensis TaxID=1999 RepID=A0A841CYY7_PLAVE|nr:hypothetical protein [Planomonospora venezuelensis]MBB5962013.1 hypothetical protein [Planomonospora venezuelensis]GIN00113.1 hypothetical protein Pve01_17710 [Planomonospora venezuelensis]